MKTFVCVHSNLPRGGGNGIARPVVLLSFITRKTPYTRRRETKGSQLHHGATYWPMEKT